MKEASAICKEILVYEKNVSVGVRLLWVGILAFIHKLCDPGQMTQSRFPVCGTRDNNTPPER